MLIFYQFSLIKLIELQVLILWKKCFSQYHQISPHFLLVLSSNIFMITTWKWSIWFSILNIFFEILFDDTSDLFPKITKFSKMSVSDLHHAKLSAKKGIFFESYRLRKKKVMYFRNYT